MRDTAGQTIARAMLFGTLGVIGFESVPLMFGFIVTASLCCAIAEIAIFGVPQ
jgi:hypothetical protein